MSSRTILGSLLLLTLLSGCANFWHEMQPHRIRRVNRGPAPSMNPDFTSVNRAKAVDLAKLEDQPARPTVEANVPSVTLVSNQIMR